MFAVQMHIRASLGHGLSLRKEECFYIKCELVNIALGLLFRKSAAQSHPRFPWAAGEPTRATALRSLTVAFPPTGVSDGFGLLSKEMIIRYYIFYYSQSSNID